MSHSRRSRGRGLDDEVYARKRRKRKRVERRKSRRRAVLFALAAVITLLFVAAGAVVTSVVAFGADCDLKTLRPVSIGQNSFIYAADNSILGAIPAEKNRQPVPLRRISAWMPKATVAIGDRRFYEHGRGRRRGHRARPGQEMATPARSSRAAPRSRSSSSGNLTVSREQTVERVPKEACLAIKLNDAWSKRKILATYMNQVYYGNLAYGIEAAAQTYSRRMRGR